MVLSSHGTDLRLASRFPQFISILLSKMWKQLEGWNTVSTFLAGIAERIHLPNNGRVDVIPLPMNDHLFSPDPAVKRDRTLIVAVTKFTKQKRVDQFIRSIEISKKSNSSIHAEIYGTGPDKESLQALIQSLELSSSIRLLEPVPQEMLVDIYRRSGAVVLNSVEEGFGAVLVEAMLCGTPVIGANSGGIPDIIEHGKSGLLVPPDDIPSLASAMLQISSDTNLADRLGLAGRERAVTRFSSDVLIKQYADLIHAAAKADQDRRNHLS
jgi:glycosyltransferase involved in cell wall biosynthesis